MKGNVMYAYLFSTQIQFAS